MKTSQWLAVVKISTSEKLHPEQCGSRDFVRRDRSIWYRILPIVFWVVALATVPILSSVQEPATGWDLHVYANAVQSLRAGHDPYADGIAVQRAVHSQRLLHPDPFAAVPFTYVYSPITLPPLRLVSSWPPLISYTFYWLIYAIGSIAIVWVALQATEPKERRTFSLIAPAALFFPGFLLTMVLLSGNLSYILYGLIFTGALLGWRRGRWTWFYLATVIASCYKAPLLSLLAIPVLSARKQWLPTCLAGVAGIVLFAIQPLVWPSAFHHYMEAVELQFSYNHDFGLSPSGLLGNTLFFHGFPYSFASTLCYVLYAPIVFGTLLYLARRFFAGHFSLQQWIPVMLLGVILLNPRIKEYDVAVLSLPMALVAWRLFARGNTFARTALETSLFFIAVNAIASNSPYSWQPTEGTLLVGLFVAGCWHLLHPAGNTDPGVSGQTVSIPRQKSTTLAMS